jgi:hypothetical protein
VDALIETIRNAGAADATNEARAAGAQACRTILAALEATTGEPMSASVVDTSPLMAAVSMLRGVPPDQLLDLAIAKLKASLPAGVEAPKVEPLKFHIIQLPPRG